MLTYKEAQSTLISLAKSFGTETVPLQKAPGRTLAELVKADRDYPPFNRAAMDGYAINIKDFKAGIRDFEVAEIIFAGQISTRKLITGQCYKIMTGAAVPLSANTIIRREDTDEKGEWVTLLVEDGKKFQNISKKGEDYKEDDVVVDQPCVCSPAVISLLASLGKPKVSVQKLPSVGIFTTGDEIVPIDQELSPVQIRNSNQYLLQSLLQKWNIVPLLWHIKDDFEQLRTVFARALTLDMIIISGGVSAGDADYVPRVFDSIGVKELFHKVAIKPGKPIWCGHMPNGGVVFALPGNPFSCHVTYSLFIETYLQKCFGLPVKPFIELPIMNNRNKKTPLDEFFPVRLQTSPFGVEPLVFNGSGDISAALKADGLALHPSQEDKLEKGTLVEYIPLTSSL